MTNPPTSYTTSWDTTDFVTGRVEQAKGGTLRQRHSWVEVCRSKTDP